MGGGWREVRGRLEGGWREARRRGRRGCGGVKVNLIRN